MTPSAAGAEELPPSGAPADESSGAAPSVRARPARPRMAAGATGSLVCALIAPALTVAALMGGSTLRRMLPLVERTGLTPRFTLISMLVLAAVAASVVLGIISVFLGRTALRDLKSAPVPLRGAGRARLGMILGVLSIASPCLIALVSRAAGF